MIPPLLFERDESKKAKLKVSVAVRRGGAHRIISARRTNVSEERAYGRR